MKEIEEEITTLEELINLTDPKSIFIAVEVVLPDLDDLVSSIEKRFNGVAQRILNKVSNIIITRTPVIKTQPPKTKEEDPLHYPAFTFVNDNSSWSSIGLNDLTLLYTIDKNIVVVKANQIKTGTVLR